MLALILVLLAAPQPFVEMYGTPCYSVWSWDAGFEEAQETMVVHATTSDNRSFLGAIPFPVAVRMMRMGDRVPEVRDLACRELRDMGEPIHRWLYRGLLIPDPEIAWRCESLLGYLTHGNWRCEGLPQYGGIR